MPNPISTTAALSAPRAGTAPAVPPTLPPPLATGPGTPNPTLRLDPALGLVVLQFNAGGQTQTIPTQQQLDAYRSGGLAPPKA